MKLIIFWDNRFGKYQELCSSLRLALKHASGVTDLFCDLIKIYRFCAAFQEFCCLKGIINAAMKNGSLVIILGTFCLFGIVQGQTDSVSSSGNLSKQKRVWETGAHVYRLDLAPFSYFPGVHPSSRIVKHGFLSGLYLKYYSGVHVVRASLNYFEEEEQLPYWGYYGNSIRSRTGLFSAGYQRLFLKGRFSPYLFNDLSYSYGQKDMLPPCFTCLTPQAGTEPIVFWDTSQLPGMVMPYRTQISAIGFSQGFGLRYNPFKSFVISVETFLHYSFVFERHSGYESRRQNYTDLRIYPVQTSIGLLF